jgi:outer membrane protein
MPSRLVVSLTAALGLCSAAGAALAQSQPYTPVEAPKTWTVQIGGGVTYGFSATGNTGSDYTATPWASANYRDIVYANGLDGIGWNAIKTDSFRVGLQLRPRFAAGDIEGSSLERPDLGADASVYAYQRLPGNIVVGGRVSQDATGDDAGLEYYASVGHQRVTPVGLLRASAYVRGGDDERVQRYYGVSAAQAPGSGYAVFEPQGGLSGAGAAVFLAVPVGERFGLGGFANYEQRLGDIKDSPLVAEDHVWRAGLIGVVRFSSGH